MLRAIALSLALLVGLGTIIPLATDYTEAGAHKPKKKKKKRAKYKKYSKKWWRAYRARQKRKRALAKRRRQMRVRRILLARDAKPKQTDVKQNAVAKTAAKPVAVPTAPAMLPSGEAAPKSWKSNSASSNELQFRVDDDNGAQIGLASISIVGPAMGADNNSGRTKTLGGVPVVSLRSTVIDKMIRENGWVVNDYQKDIGGKKVYVVVAQSESGGSVQSRMFYFTEVDGRIYSVATTAPNASSERIVQESEKVIDSLQRRKPTQQAMNQ